MEGLAGWGASSLTPCAALASGIPPLKANVSIKASSTSRKLFASPVAATSQRDACPWCPRSSPFCSAFPSCVTQPPLVVASLWSAADTRNSVVCRSSRDDKLRPLDSMPVEDTLAQGHQEDITWRSRESSRDSPILGPSLSTPRPETARPQIQAPLPNGQEPPLPILETSPGELWTSLEPALGYLEAGEREVVRDALGVAFWAHDGQKRKSGEPFIIHPVEVTRILAELEMDWESLVAGLLHDTVEDTDRISFAEIEKKYGTAVRRIVEGETKVSKLGKMQPYKEGTGSLVEQSESNNGAAVRSQDLGPAASPSDDPGASALARKARADVKADDLRQMFLAMTQEVRVIIVKLADRLHNMRTLGHMPPHKQEHIARETLRVFAPLARLLGMYGIKSELEDLSFRYAFPGDYARVRERLGRLQESQAEGMRGAQAKLQRAMERDQFLALMTSSARVECRWKEPYSIFRKMIGKECKLEELQGVAQVRVVLALKSELMSDEQSFAQQVCYHVLGLVHSMWPPLPGSVKDYIATPKPNGYQSLHTTVLPLGSQELFPLEVQIRTVAMDRLAEGGITTQLGEAAAAAAAAAVDAARRLSGAPGSEQGGALLTTEVQGLALPNGVDTAGATVGREERSDAALMFNAEEMTARSEQAGEEHRGSQGRACEQGTPSVVSEDRAGSREVSRPLGQQPPRLALPGSLDEPKGVSKKVSWLNAIREWQEEFVGNLSAREFVDTVTGDLLGSRIFVFTPKGEVINLPKEATVIDYAYSMSSEVGNEMYAAKVNGNFVAPTSTLCNADIVEVLTYPAHASSIKGYSMRQVWLNHVKTRSARHKLLKFLKEQASAVTAQSVREFAGDVEVVSSGEDSFSESEEAPFLSALGKRQGDTAEGFGGVAQGPEKSPRALGGLDQPSGNGAVSSNGAVTAPSWTEASKSSKRNGGVSIRPAIVKRAGNGAWKARRPSCEQVRDHPPPGSQLSTDTDVVHEVLVDFSEWQELTVNTWQRLSGGTDPVQWVCVYCYDRGGLLSESSKILTDAGLLILTHAGRTNQERGVGVMLFEVEAEPDSDLATVASTLMLVDDIIGYSMGCSWEAQDRIWV